jgi:hypothetical protein
MIKYGICLISNWFKYFPWEKTSIVEKGLFMLSKNRFGEMKKDAVGN